MPSLNVFFNVKFASKKLTKREISEYFEIWIDFFLRFFAMKRHSFNSFLLEIGLS